MNRIAVVTGADRGLGIALCEGLLNKGWKVFAGQFMPAWTELAELSAKYPEMLNIIPLDVSSSQSVKEAVQLVTEVTNHVDLLINNAGIGGGNGDIREGLNYSIPQSIYNVNSLGPIRMVEGFLTLLEKGMKRLCFVSSEAGSIGVCVRDQQFGYCMSKTALNMAIKMMFNDLHPKGYTFRIYHPGWLRTYMTGKKSTNGNVEPMESASSAIQQFLEDRDYEECLLMLDNKEEAWPF